MTSVPALRLQLRRSALEGVETIGIQNNWQLVFPDHTAHKRGRVGMARNARADRQHRLPFYQSVQTSLFQGDQRNAACFRFLERLGHELGMKAADRRKYRLRLLPPWTDPRPRAERPCRPWLRLPLCRSNRPAPARGRNFLCSTLAGRGPDQRRDFARRNQVELQRRDDGFVRRADGRNYGRPGGEHSEDVSRTGRGKGHDRVGPRHRAHLFAHDVGVGAGWNIHRDNRRGARIHRGNGFGIQPAHRRAETGAEDGIHQNVRIKNRPCRFGLQLFIGDGDNGRDGQSA